LFPAQVKGIICLNPEEIQQKGNNGEEKCQIKKKDCKKWQHSKLSSQ